MPATRSIMRQASRQPYQVNGGSAHPNTIQILQDGEGSPQKKQAVDRKLPRQRSKQKAARVPLPPTADVIEISSDEDAPPNLRKASGSMNAHQRRAQVLEEENKALKAALAAMKTAPLPPPSPSPVVQPPAPDVKYDKFLSAVEDHVTCEVCALKMWHPYTLACGHTFCKRCLQDWFSTALLQHLLMYPNYDAQRVVPGHLRAALAHQELTPPERQDLERKIAIILSSTPHPQYSCPTCRVLVRAHPAENFVVKHLVRTIAGVQGESPPQEPARIAMRPFDGAFDGFFPCTM